MSDITPRDPLRGLRAVTQRAGWGMLDQGLSSLTNFALGVFVAATVNASEFGIFTLIYGGYNVIVGMSQGLVSFPLTIRFSAETGERRERAERASLGAALEIGCLAGACCLFGSMALGGSSGASLAAMGFVLPGLLTQDAWRFAFMTRAQPVLAVVNDGTWAFLQLAGLSTLVATGRVSVATLVLVWGGSATIAAIVGALQAGVWPSLRLGPVFVREQRDLAGRFAIEALGTRAGPFVVISAVGAVAGVGAVAALRGAQLVILGVPNLLFLGLGFVIVPEGVRLVHDRPDQLGRLVRAVTVGAATATIIWCAVALTGSAFFGDRVLGDTWPLARPVLPAAAVSLCFVAITVGPAHGLWILAAAARSIRIRLFSTALTLAAVFPAAAVAGASGAASAMAAAAAVAAGLWWREFRSAYTSVIAAAANGLPQQTEPVDPVLFAAEGAPLDELW